MPISIRTPGDPAGGNRITLMRFAVPTAEPDPVKRMQAVHEKAAAARHEASIPLTGAIAWTLNLLPNGVVGGMLKHVDFLASNVPGLDAPIFLGGAEVTGIYPFGPTIGAALERHTAVVLRCLQHRVEPRHRRSDRRRRDGRVPARRLRRGRGGRPPPPAGAPVAAG